MTRITDFGRKRTHVQAGFPDDSEPVEEPTEPHASTSTLPSESQPHDQAPPKKKRKRTKKPKENGDDGGEKAGPSEDKAQDVGDSETAKAVPKKKLKDKRKPKTRPDPAQRSESRRQKRIAEKYADTTCFACRQKGHTARDCPTTRNEASGGGGGGMTRQRTVGICYRCGSNQHTLSRCKAPEDPHHPLPFASCFVCSGKGHLASSCPQNKDKGVYPNGGCCKLCGETFHLAKDCGLRKQAQSGTATFVGTGQSAGADEDDFHTFKRRDADVDRDIKKDERAKKKADVKFASYTGTVKAFGTPVGNSAKVKVVYF